MEPIELLKQQARDRRNVAIQAAKREYFFAIKEIRALQRKLRLERRGRPRQALYDTPIMGGDSSCQGMPVIRAVETILAEGRPMTLVELTIEVQRRGCRARDDSRVVAKAVRNSLSYRREWFKRDGAGRWSVVS